MSQEDDEIEIVQSQCFITSIFEVQLATGRTLEALNATLLTALRACRARGEQGTPYANGGWISPNDLNERPEFAEFFERVQGAMSACATVETIPEERWPAVSSAWGAIMKRGDFTRFHLHPWSAWSGVYYVQVDDLGGDLYFMDPRPGARTTVCPSTEVKDRSMVDYRPKTGTLILFPSYLEHYTEPSRSDAERVLISFNASLRA